MRGRSGSAATERSTSRWSRRRGRRSSSLLEGNVLEALRRQLGATAPAKLRFAVGPIPEQPAALEPVSSAPAEPLDVPPEVESEATSAAAAIDDPELRELVARAARTSLLKARSGR